MKKPQVIDVKIKELGCLESTFDRLQVERIYSNVTYFIISSRKWREQIRETYNIYVQCIYSYIVLLRAKAPTQKGFPYLCEASTEAD